MTRAMTSDELVALRSNNQASKLFFWAHKPRPLFQARINQTFDSLDSVGYIYYDTVTLGSESDVRDGATVFIGTSAGAHDVGVCRVRGMRYPTQDGNRLNIGETSDIQFIDNLYITVTDDFAPWQRHIYIDPDGTVEYDWDEEYERHNAHVNFFPLVRMGANAVVWLDDGAVSVGFGDASQSYIPNSSPASYLWSVTPTTGVTISNTASPTPTVTVSVPGVDYLVICKVTAANGKINYGYRYIFAFDKDHMPITDFNLSRNPEADYQSGGWSFGVSLYGEAADTDVYNRSLCVLFARDYYDKIEGSLAPVAGRENIIALGYTDGETLYISPDGSHIELNVDNPARFLDIESAYPEGWHYNASPTKWVDMPALTVDRGLHDMFVWRSTIGLICDVFPTGSTLYMSALDVQSESLWNQIKRIAYSTILAVPAFNRYGQLYVEVDPQFEPIGERSGFPVVMAITKDDRADSLRLERSRDKKVGLLELSGVAYDGATATPLFSRAAGNAKARTGNNENIDNLAVSSQSQVNTLAGNVVAARNDEFPAIDIELVMNNRFIDICPRQYLTLSIAAEDTPRGFVWINQKILPRRITLEWRADGNYFTVTLQCAKDTDGPAGISYFPPLASVNNFPAFPDLGFPDFSGGVPFPQPGSYSTSPEGVDCADTNPAPNGGYNVGLSGVVDTYATKVGGFYSSLRPNTVTNKSNYVVNGLWETFNGTSWVEDVSDDTWWECVGMNGGTVVATGVKDSLANPRHRTGHFNNTTAKAITGIGIRLKSGAPKFPIIDTITTPTVVGSISGSHKETPILITGNISMSTGENTYSEIDIDWKFKTKLQGYWKFTVESFASDGNVSRKDVGLTFLPSDVWSGYINPPGMSVVVDNHLAALDLDFVLTAIFNAAVGESGSASFVYKIEPMPLHRITLTGVFLGNVCSHT